jgi:hypothetical protein
MVPISKTPLAATSGVCVQIDQSIRYTDPTTSWVVYNESL